MPDPADRKRDAAASFGSHPDAYLESPVHRVGDDLDRLAAWCADADLALDVATGAGHTAGALADVGVGTVVAADAAVGMLDTATVAYPRVHAVAADAERLPFPAGRFGAVACRIAAHHFPAPRALVGEVARVLRDGGTFAFEDNVAPPDPALDRFINRVERLRDPTHVRSHPVADWLDWLRDAGLVVEDHIVTTKTIEYDAWQDQLDVPPDRRAALDAVFDAAPPGAADCFRVVAADGTVESFASRKVLVRATKRGPDPVADRPEG